MNLLDLTPSQLRQAAAIKEQMDDLGKDLRGLLGESPNSRRSSTKKRTMSAAVKRKIAAAQKARWASLRRSEPAFGSARPAIVAKKKAMSPAAKSKVSAKLKAYWASKRAVKK
jgi:hypothetical protein